METQNPASSCRNCHTPLQPDTRFCHACGQKNTDGRFSFGELFHHFIDSVFNLDGRIFNTLKALIRPGRLTIDYFQGKHIPYYHPVRLFIVSAAILIAMISLKIDQENIQDLGEGWREYESNHLKHEHLTELKAIRDSLIPAYDEPVVGIVIDSMLSKFEEGTSDSANISVGMNIQLGTIEEEGSIRVAVDDLVTMSTDSLIAKYDVKGFWPRLFFTQSIRIQQRGDSFVFYVIGNILWMMLVMMPMLALVLKLLYVRRGFLYFEHLVFSFHTHTALFLLLSLVVLLNDYLPGFTKAIVSILMFVYLLLAMKRFYRQGWIKTILKLVIANFAYFFILLTAMMLVAIVSLLLF